MLVPAVGLTIVFHYIPMGGIVLAFKQYNYRLGFWGSPWVGLRNFEFFFQSGEAWLVTRNTLLYNIAFMIVNTSLQLLFAMILSELGSKLFRKLAQSFMFLPHFISWVVVASMAFNLFNYENGAINNLLVMLGQERVNIYGTPGIWKYLLVIFKAWKTVGYGTVVYLAAIVGIDAELHEAAEIDGANIFQRMAHITLPSIIPSILILTLLGIGQIFRGDFGLFYQMIGNNGMLFDATDIIDTFVFRSLTQSNNMAMAAAAGFYQSVMCFITIMITNYIVRRVDKDYALF